MKNSIRHETAHIQSQTGESIGKVQMQWRGGVPSMWKHDTGTPWSGVSEAAKGGVKLPAEYMPDHPNMLQTQHAPHAQCLKLIQAAMKDPKKEPQCRKLYETVGVYLGYGLAQYMEFYKIDHVMILGRVSKGTGGDIMLDTAKKVLETEFPEYAKIQFHTADDHFKGVGQCIAETSRRWRGNITFRLRITL